MTTTDAQLTDSELTVLPGAATSLAQRLHPALPEIAKFVVIGGLCSVLDLVIANALHFLVGVGPTLAKCASTLVATAVSYAANRAWSFGHRVDHATSQHRDVAVFTVLNLLGLVITLVPVDVVHYVLGQTSPTAFNASSVAGTLVATVFRFWAYRRFVFTATDGPATPARGRAPVSSRSVVEGTSSATR